MIKTKNYTQGILCFREIGKFDQWLPPVLTLII